MQNRSHAVMAQRHEPLDSADDFPTPPWATFALLHHLLGTTALKPMTCLEPACGRGHMAKVLKEFFVDVTASDLHDYGYGAIRDFINEPYPDGSYDWVITNPPFKAAEEFIQHALRVARVGVAILGRTNLLESKRRYENIFIPHPVTTFAPFVERVPIVKGRLDAKATTATSYAWYVWLKIASSLDRLHQIPPCRKELERPGDYDLPAGLNSTGSPADAPDPTSSQHELFTPKT